MAGVQATIDLVVRGSSAVNRLIQDVNQLQGAIDRINSRTLDIGPRDINAAIGGVEEQLRDARALDQRTNAQQRLNDALRDAVVAEQQLAARARDNLNPNTQVHRRIQNNLDRSRAAAAEAAAEIGRLNDSFQTLFQQGREAAASRLRAAVPSFGELINLNQVAAAQTAVRVLAQEFNRLGDSVQRGNDEQRITGADLPRQINQFNQLARSVQAATDAIEELEQRRRRLGEREVLQEPPTRLQLDRPTVDVRSSLVNYAAAERQAAEMLEREREVRAENRRIEARNRERTEIDTEIERRRAEITALSEEARQAGESAVRMQSRLADIVEARQNVGPAGVTGLNTSLNQIQAQAEALALVANNSRLASDQFRQFTVATELASIKLARSQQETFSTLAGAFSSGMTPPEGLRDTSGGTLNVAGARRAVGDLIDYIPNLTRSQAALSSYLGLLRQVQTLLPFTSREFRQLEEAVAGLEQELEGATAQGRSRQNRAAAMREEQRRNIETRRNELQRRASALGTGGLTAAVQLGRITPEMTAERPYEATGILNQVQRRLKIQEQISQNAQREAEERRSATKALQTQLTTLKSLSIDLQKVQQTGVQIERERAGLGELINSIEEGRYNNSKLSVSIVGEEIKKYRALLGLRSKEAAMPAPSGPAERIGDIAARRRYTQELERQFSISAKIAQIDKKIFPSDRKRLFLDLKSASDDLMNNRLESARQITDEIERQLEIMKAAPAPSGPAERVGDLGAQLKYAREVADLYERQGSLFAGISTKVRGEAERKNLLDMVDSASDELANNRLETSKKITDEIEKQLQLTIKQESATAKNQRQIDILREGMANLQQFYKTAAAGGADVSVELKALEDDTARFTNSKLAPTQKNVDAMREVLRQSTSALELAKSKNAEDRIAAKNTQRLANLQGELASASERAMQLAQRLQSIMAGTTGDPAIEAQINAAQQITTENEAFLRDRKAGLSVEAEYEAMAKKQATAVGSIRGQYRKLLTIQAEYRKAENKGATFSKPEKEALQAVVENVRMSAEAGISTPARQSIVGEIIKTFGEILRLRKAEASSMDEAANNQRTLSGLVRDGAKLLSLYNKAETEGLSMTEEKSRLQRLLNEMASNSLPITEQRLSYLKAELDCAADILQIEKTYNGIEEEGVKTRQKLLTQQRELLLLQSLYNKSEAQGAQFTKKQRRRLSSTAEEVNRLIQTQPEAAKSLVAAIDAKIKKIEYALRLEVAKLDEAAAKFRAEEGKAGVTTKSSKLESAIAASEISAETKTQLETKRQAAFGRLAKIGPTATLGLLSSIEKEFNAEVRLANQRKKDASEETQNKSKLNTLLKRGIALQAALNAASAAGLDVSEAKAELQAEINKLDDPNTKNTKENVSLARDQLTNAITALRVAREQADKIRDQNKEQEKLNIQIERQAKLEKTIQELQNIKEPSDFLTQTIQSLQKLNKQAKEMITPPVKEEGPPLKPSPSGAKSALDEANKLLQLKKEQEERQAKLNNLVKRGDSIIQAFNTAGESGLNVSAEKKVLQEALNKAKLHEATLNKGSVQETRDAISVAISELRIAKEKNNQGKIQSKIAREIAEYEAKRKQLEEDVTASRLEEATRKTIIQTATPTDNASQEEKTKALRAAEELLKSETKSLEIQEKAGTQRLALQNLLKRYNELEKQGVEFSKEKLELSDAIRLINATGFKFTQANVNAFDLLLQRGAQYVRLRKAESMEAGTFIPGGRPALELRRARLLENALKFQKKLDTDTAKLGIDFGGERVALEQEILKLKEMQNKTTVEGFNSAALAIAEIKTNVQNLRNTIEEVSKISGIGAKIKEFQAGLVETGAFFGTSSPGQAVSEIVQSFNNRGAIPDEMLGRLEEAAGRGAQGLLSLSELKNPAKASTASLELLSNVLKSVYTNLEPNTEGFKQLEKQVRETILSLDELTASRAPDADFLTRMTKSPRMANAISEGLIGGMFPLLFGQGIGSSLFGGLGGGLGGFAGGGLGFGLSLFGTAIGGMFDALNQAAQETGKSLNYPIEGFDKLKEANLFASREQEYYISKLIESGQTTKATAEIQAQMIEKIGVNGVNDLMKLGDASSELSKVWAEFTLQLQAALAGPMTGLLNWVADVVKLSTGGPQKEAQKLDPIAFEEARAKAASAGSPFGIIGDRAKYEKELDKFSREIIAKAEAPLVNTPKEDPQTQEQSLQTQRQVADEIKSAYREGFQLQQKIIDAEIKGAEIRRRLANEIIEKQQELDRRQIEAMQKRAQISIETLDLEYQRRISAQEGRSAEILAAEAEFLKTRLQGEAETAAKRKTLEIDVSRLKRAAEEYIYNLSKEADSIRRDTLSLEMDAADYRLSIERKIEDARRSNKRGESQMTGYEDGKIPSAAQIGAKSLTPREKATLATIRWAETGTSGPESYRKLFGGGMFTDLSRHPDRVVRAGGYASAAAGAYQFMPKTWEMTGGGSMAPERQDAAALWLALKRGANVNKMGFTKEFVAKLAPEWASLPTLSGRSYYGQPVRSFKELERYYNAQLKAAQTRGSDWNAGMSGGNWPAGVPKPKALQTAEAAGGMGGQRMAAERPSFPGGFLGIELQLGAALSQVGTSIRRRLGEGIQVGAIAGQRAQLLTQEIGLEQELVALEEKISKLQDQKSFQKLTDVITGKKEIEQRVRANELARAELAALAPMSQEKQEALFLEIRGKKEIADLEEENLNYIKSVLANNKYTKKEQDALINAAAANVDYAKERNRLDAENLQIAQKRRFAEEMINLRQDLRRKNLSVEAGFFGAAASAYADELRVSGDVGQAIDKARLTRAKEIAETVINAKEELMSLMDVNNLKAGAAGAISGAVGEGFKGTLGVLTSMDTFAERSGINAQIKQLEKLRAGLKETDPEYVELSKKIGEARGKLAELGDTGLKVQRMLADMFQNIANHFLDMASQMIAKWVQLELMNRLLPLFSRPTAPSSGSSDLAASFLSTAFQLPGYMNAAPDIASGFLTTAFQMPSYMSGASIPTPFAKGGAFSNSIVSSPTLFRYADGGTFATGYIGEAGPEAVMPLTRGPGGRLGVDATNAGGGDINVVVNVDASGSNVQGDDRQAGQLGQAIATAVRQELISQKRPGGLLA